MRSIKELEQKIHSLEQELFYSKSCNSYLDCRILRVQINKLRNEIHALDSSRYSCTEHYKTSSFIRHINYNTKINYAYSNTDIITSMDTKNLYDSYTKRGYAKGKLLYKICNSTIRKFRKDIRNNIDSLN